MSGVKQHNPNSRAAEIIAALALREPLHSIERICDEQKQISTARLYAYATEAGDKLAGYACELRQAITSLRQDHAEAQRLLRENDALAQRCKELEGRADALSQELQATLGDWNALVRAIQSPTHGGAVAHAAGVVRERDALRAEVEQLHQQAARYERLRRLDPRQLAELHQRNLAGERFDDMVDAL